MAAAVSFHIALRLGSILLLALVGVWPSRRVGGGRTGGQSPAPDLEYRETVAFPPASLLRHLVYKSLH